MLASYMVFIAAVMDFLDGFSARLLNAYSEIGKQMDSLADLVSFGIAPAFIASYEIFYSMGISFQSPVPEPGIYNYILVLMPLLLVVASAFRLAKFNIDPSQTESFSGLPSPASGLFFASLPLLGKDFFSNPAIIAALLLIFSYLLVSGIPMFSLKIRNIRDRKHIPAYILAVISLILLIVFSLKAVFLIVILYIFISLIILLLPNKSN